MFSENNNYQTLGRSNTRFANLIADQLNHVNPDLILSPKSRLYARIQTIHKEEFENHAESYNENLELKTHLIACKITDFLLGQESHEYSYFKDSNTAKKTIASAIDGVPMFMTAFNYATETHQYGEKRTPNYVDNKVLYKNSIGEIFNSVRSLPLEDLMQEYTTISSQLRHRAENSNQSMQMNASFIPISDIIFPEIQSNHSNPFAVMSSEIPVQEIAIDRRRGRNAQATLPVNATNITYDVPEAESVVVQAEIVTDRQRTGNEQGVALTTNRNVPGTSITPVSISSPLHSRQGLPGSR